MGWQDNGKLYSLLQLSVLPSSAIDRGFEPRSCQTKDYNGYVLCIL